jgi:flagellar hook assembly protein FlgD
LGNYPNPFNPRTTIRFQLAETEYVSLAVYNLSGQLIRILIDGERNVGIHSVNWDGLADDGREVAGGVYMLQLIAGPIRSTVMMTLMR